MKPRNKEERRVVELQSKLPKISQRQLEEAKYMLCDIVKYENSYWCCKCGGSWKSESDSKYCVCPHCGNKIKPVSKGIRKRVFDVKFYYAIMTVVEDYQVARTFLCERKSIKNKGLVDFDISEVFQLWMKPGQKKIVYGRRVNPCSMFVDAWCYSHPLEIRNWHYRYDFEGYLSKDVKLHQVVKRNGLIKIRKDISYVDQVYGVMNDPRCEILAKAKQWSMLKVVSRGRFDNDLWQSVRIALRHRYLIKDASLWCDMVSMLKKCGKDIHNPKFVCPSSLMDGHDFAQRLNDRRLQKEEEERIRKENQELADRLSSDSEYAEKFNAKYARWLNICIVHDKISLMPLQSIMDFKKEGDILHHCVFSNKYYEHEDTLIVGARVDGKRTETIEIDTKRFVVVQCRGMYNQPSDYHEDIMSLITSNMNVFRQATA